MIIVTGTGRTGTSAVARVLHESGISMGQDFAGPSPQNATGYYEELSVVAVNERIFLDCGLQRSNSLPWRTLRKARRVIDPGYAPPPGRAWVSRSALQRAAARYRRTMQHLASQVPSPGGWKATHLAWTLEAWLPSLPRKPRIVLCLRSPEAVAQSATAYFGLTDDSIREWALRRWLNQYTRLLEVIEDYTLESFTIEYDELITNTCRTVARLSDFVGHPLDPDYVEPVLRHHAGRVPERFAEVYERVRALGAVRLPTRSAPARR